MSDAADALAPAPETAPNPAPEAPKPQEQPPAPKEPEQAKLFEADDTKAQLAELKKQNEKLARQLKAQEDAKLEEAGKYKELADKRAQELQETQQRLQSMAKRTALQAEAVKAGLQSMDFLKLVDLDSLQLEGDQVVGADAAISGLRESHPMLFEKRNAVPTPNVTPGNAGVKIPDPTRSYTSSELRGLSDEQMQAYFDQKYGNANKNPI